MATKRSRTVSRALYTSPMAPWPILAMISYFPMPAGGIGRPGGSLYGHTPADVSTETGAMRRYGPSGRLRGFGLLLLRRREEHQAGEVVADAVEVVFRMRFHGHHGAGLDGVVLAIHGEDRLAARYVVDLVLPVR